jgi:hypothetical protein
MIDPKDHLDIKIKNRIPEKIFRMRIDEIRNRYGLSVRHSAQIVKLFSAYYYNSDTEKRIEYFNLIIERAKRTPRDKFLNLKEKDEV